MFVDMHEADNYIRYLNTGVVDVVLNFHPFTSALAELLTNVSPKTALRT